MAIAEQKAIQLPKELPADAQQRYEELQQLTDAKFDEAYMDEMVKDHEEDIEAFEQQAQSGQDPDLRAFAEEARRRRSCLPSMAPEWRSSTCQWPIPKVPLPTSARTTGAIHATCETRPAARPRQGR